MQQFLEYSSQHPSSISDGVTLSFGSSYHAVFLFLIHGDEVGSLPGINQCLQELLDQKSPHSKNHKGTVSFILGNKAATEKQTRYVEHDLNRSFGRTEKPSAKEHYRAEEISSLLKQATVMIDFHQTKEQTPFPFFTFPFHRPSYFWARALGTVKHFVTRPMGASFSSLGQCSDEYAHSLSIPALTIEMSQMGCSEATTKFVLETVWETLRILDENKPIEAASQDKKDLIIYENTSFIPFHQSTECLLSSKYQNFSSIQKDELIGVDLASGDPLYAPAAGYALFPQYPQRDTHGRAIKHSDKLMRIINPMAKHPLEVF